MSNILLNKELLKKCTFYKIKNIGEVDISQIKIFDFELSSIEECHIIIIPRYMSISCNNKNITENNLNPMYDNEKRPEYKKDSCFFSLGENSRYNNNIYNVKYQIKKPLILLNWNNIVVIHYLQRHINPDLVCFFHKIINCNIDLQKQKYINRNPIESLDYKIIKELSPFFKDSILDGIIGGYMYCNNGFIIEDIMLDTLNIYSPEIIIPNLETENDITNLIDLNNVQLPSRIHSDIPKNKKKQKTIACFFESNINTENDFELGDFERTPYIPTVNDINTTMKKILKL